MGDRPTRAEVVSRLTQARSLFARLRQWMLVDIVYTHATASDADMQALMPYMRGLPNDITLKVPNLVQRSVNWGVDSIVVGEVNEVTVTLPEGTHRDPEAAKEHVQRLQDGIRELLYRIDLERGDSIDREVADKAIGLGLGAYYYPLDPRRRPDAPNGYTPDGKPKEGETPKEQEAYRRWRRRIEQRLPWAIGTVHPYNLLWDYHHNPPTWVAVETMTSDAAIAIDYPHLYPDGYRTRATTANRRLTTYIEDDWYCVMVDDRPVLTEEDGAVDGVAPNERGFIWVKQAMSGFGSDDHLGRPEYRIKGLIRDNRGTFDMKIVNLNIIQAIAAQYAFAPVVVEGPEDKRREFIDNLEWGAGAVVERDPEVKVELLDVAKVPGPVLQALQASDALLQTGVGPELNSGVAQPNEPASATRLRSSIAKAPWRNVKKNIEQAKAAMVTDLLYELKHDFDDDLVFEGRLGKVTIERDDIIDGMSVSINLAPLTAEERAYRQQELSRDLELQAISLAHYRHEMGLPEGDEVNEAIIKAEMLRGLVPAASQAVAGVLPELAQQIAGRLRDEAVASGMMPRGLEPLPPEMAPLAGPNAAMMGSDLEEAALAQRTSNAPPPPAPLAPRIAGR